MAPAGTTAVAATAPAAAGGGGPVAAAAAAAAAIATTGYVEPEGIITLAAAPAIELNNQNTEEAAEITKKKSNTD